MCNIVLTSLHKILNVFSKTNLELKRSIAAFDSNSQIFTTHFGLTSYRANEYITNHRLNRIHPKSIMKVVSFCEELGFRKNDILRNPILLRMHSSTVDQYYSVMTEGGFVNITPEMLSKFRTHYRKPVYLLKAEGFIKPQTNVAENFQKYLTPPPPENIAERTCDDSDVWTHVHLKVLTEYLKWRLQATDDEIANLIKVHTTIQRKSFRYLCENIEIAINLGFTLKKILKHGYILHAYPKHVKEVLEKYPTIAGMCVKKAMTMYPKLMTTPPSNFQEIYSILKEHNIDDEAIYKRMNVFQLSPETVEFRLRELERDGDLKVLLHNPSILKLVVHHNRAKSRLSFLKQLRLKCTRVSVLGNDDNKFDIHIRNGKDSNTSRDTCAFLKSIFKKDIKHIESILKKHPYRLQVPLKSMEETYSYLKDEKFTDSCIFKVIYILLYPKEKIENAFQLVREYEKNNKSITQLNRLNLALYFIEREHHFTGDGIWEKTESVEESAQFC